MLFAVLQLFSSKLSFSISLFGPLSKDEFNVSSDKVEVDKLSEVDDLLMDRISEVDGQSEVFGESTFDCYSVADIIVESGKHFVIDVSV